MGDKRVYLGDSVYVEIDDYGDVVLTTNNGYPDDPRNRIVLDPGVYKLLTDYVALKQETPRDDREEVR